MSQVQGSRLSYRLEKLFRQATLEPQADALPSGLSLRVRVADGVREMAMWRGPSSPGPGDKELETMAAHAGFTGYLLVWGTNLNQGVWVVMHDEQDKETSTHVMCAECRSRSMVLDALNTNATFCPVCRKVATIDAPEARVEPSLKSFVRATLLVAQPAEAHEPETPALEAQAGLRAKRSTAKKSDQLETTLIKLDAAASVASSATNAAEIAVMVTELLEYGKTHDWPTIEISPGVRVVPGEQGWRTFLTANAGYQISKLLKAAQSITPDWYKLGKNPKGKD